MIPEGLNHGHRYTERLPPEAERHSALSWLVARYAHTDLVGWRARLEAGEVEVDGATAQPDQRLRRGQRLTWSRPPWLEPAVPGDFAVLHDDGALLAVDKPSGLPTAPAGGFLEHTLLHLVRARWPDASPMHRLGRGTSGVVLFGLTPAARAEVQAAWRAGAVQKTYRARVAGQPTLEAWSISAAIGPVSHAALGEVHAVTPSGRPAVSHVRVVSRGAAEALVEVDIDTGRPHQIRAHLAHAGHPLVGDPLYGADGRPRDNALPGDLGYALHAWRLVVPRPEGALTVVAPLPVGLA